MAEKIQCEWHPELHNGRPCPFHSGYSSPFDNNSPIGLLYASKISKNLVDKDNNAITNDNYRETLELAFFEAKPRNVELMEKYVGKLVVTKEKTSYEQYGLSFLNENAFKQYDEEYDTRFTGEVIFHENGHCIDQKLASKLNNLGVPDYLTSVKTWAGTSYKSSMASSCYKSEYNGMTLQETVEKEFKKIKEADIQEMLSEIDDYVDEIARLDGSDPKEFKEFEQKLRDIEIDRYPQAYEEFKTKFPKNYRSMATKKFKRDFTVISDVISSRYYQSDKYGSKNKGLGIGHTEFYYSKNKAWGLGAEFFANVFAADTGNQKAVLDATRAYFPDSLKVYEELIKKAQEV